MYFRLSEKKGLKDTLLVLNDAEMSIEKTEEFTAMADCYSDTKTLDNSSKYFIL